MRITMAKNTSILLGEYFEKLINEQVKSGRFSSASEVIRTALRLFEQEENRTKTLVNELKAGEKSGMISNYDREKVLSNLHAKYLSDEI
jgi:antitoxin ParD1/3/4